MITIRKSKDRGHFNHGWLDTHHTFSFASYFDRNHMGFRSLRVINEDRVAPGQGFGTHGHDNMEILTYVLQGDLAHSDSMGNVEHLRAGELQLMSAGTGIEHSEFNGSKSEPVHFMQIWIRPDEHGLKPGYAQMALNKADKHNRLAAIAGTNGEPMKIHQNARVLIGEVDKDAELKHELASGRAAWVHVVRGSVSVNGKDVETGDAAAVTGEPAAVIRGRESTSEVIVFDLA
jgi:redox-sensitive bicupin YhaK (pirin superfamily)